MIRVNINFYKFKNYYKVLKCYFLQNYKKTNSAFWKIDRIYTIKKKAIITFSKVHLSVEYEKDCNKFFNFFR